MYQHCFFKTGLFKAMFILKNSNYDFEAAKKELLHRKVFKENWTDYDVTLFKRCCRTYGKSFCKFKELVSPGSKFWQQIIFLMVIFLRSHRLLLSVLTVLLLPFYCERKILHLFFLGNGC